MSPEMLVQEHGNEHRPTALDSIQLDSVAPICPNCLQATVSATKLVEALGNDIDLYFTYLFNSELTQYFSASGLLLLHPSAPRSFCFRHLIYILNVATSLTPPTLPPLPQGGGPHDCELIMSHFVKPHPDLQDTPLTNSDLILCADESHYKNEKGIFQAGCAVTIQEELLESNNLPQAKSSPQSSVPLLEHASYHQKDELLIFMLITGMPWGSHP